MIKKTIKTDDNSKLTLEVKKDSYAILTFYPAGSVRTFIFHLRSSNLQSIVKGCKSAEKELERNRLKHNARAKENRKKCL